MLFKVTWERGFISFVYSMLKWQNFFSAEEFKMRKVLDQKSILRKRKHFKRGVQVKHAEAGLKLKEHIASFFFKINNPVETATSLRHRLHYLKKKICQVSLQMSMQMRRPLAGGAWLHKTRVDH